jgi:uncharacterized repeat protein (TIGR01451 family)
VPDPPTPTRTPTRGPEPPDEVDLALEKTGPARVELGAAVTYTLTVTNAGPDDAFHARLTDTVPAAITGVTWTCASTGQAACGAGAGSGNAISVPVTINDGDANRVTLTISGTASLVGRWTNTARVTAPKDGTIEDNLTNNQASVTTEVVDTAAPPDGTATGTVTPTAAVGGPGPPPATATTTVTTTATPTPMASPTATPTPLSEVSPETRIPTGLPRTGTGRDDAWVWVALAANLAWLGLRARRRRR